MNVDTFLKIYQKNNSIEKNTREDMFKFNEFKFDGYDIGVISNLNKKNKYEVYLYVEANNRVASNLLYIEKESPFDATNYFEELSALASEGSLEKIALKINSSKKWHFFELFLKQNWTFFELVLDLSSGIM